MTFWIIASRGRRCFSTCLICGAWLAAFVLGGGSAAGFGIYGSVGLERGAPWDFDPPTTTPLHPSLTAPETGLGSALAFVPDLATPPVNGHTLGAEIDVMAVNLGDAGTRAGTTL